MADLGGGRELKESGPSSGPGAEAVFDAAHHPGPGPSDAQCNLLRELECVVCRDVMIRPYMICRNGHASACMLCYLKLKVVGARALALKIIMNPRPGGMITTLSEDLCT